MRWHDRDEAQIQRQLPGLVAFIRAVHQQVAGGGQIRDRAQQLAALWGIVGLSR